MHHSATPARLRIFLQAFGACRIADDMDLVPDREWSTHFPLSLRRSEPAYSPLIGIVVPFAAGVLGSVTVSSPFLNVAMTFPASTPTGSRTPRVNAP